MAVVEQRGGIPLCGSREVLRTSRCARCGHIADEHRLDDSTNVSPVDPDAKFRCVAPGCDCPDWQSAEGMKSSCCGADARVWSSGEGTAFYTCVACRQPCDGVAA